VVAPNPDRIRTAPAQHELREHVREIVGSVANSAWRPAVDRPVPIVQLVVAAGRPFRVTVEMIDCAAAIGGVMPVVTIQEVTSRQTLSQWIRNRFGLTSREARVAIHLTRRRSNAEIARALQISPHTARRHTERVMAKLNVHRRIEVRKKILAAINSLERRRGNGPSATVPRTG
jgi:DNA-binding CsgD family transcriptional regulator